MSHRFEFKVSVEVSRESGHFATRDEMAEQLRDEIEGSSPSYLSGLGSWGDGEYVVDDFQIEDDDSEDRIKKLRDQIRKLEKTITDQKEALAARDRDIQYLVRGE